MEFVLFLCAALSALTGAITGVRAPGVAVQMERVSVHAIVSPAPARVVAAIVRAQRVAGLGDVRSLDQARRFVLAAAMPLFGNRRRE